MKILIYNSIKQPINTVQGCKIKNFVNIQQTAIQWNDSQIPIEELIQFIFQEMQKFPEDIQCIVDPVKGRGGIYVSNIQAAENPETLKRLGIEAVITAIKGKNLDKVIPRHIEYLYVPAIDHETFDISFYFEQAGKFINDERKRTNVLVHCMAGVSRSVSLVIAYFIKYESMRYQEAYNLVKSRRNIIHPNSSFISQLKQYEVKMLKGLNESSIRVTPNQDQILKQSVVIKVQNKVGIQQNYDEFLKQNIRKVFMMKQKDKSPIRNYSSSSLTRSQVSGLLR